MDILGMCTYSCLQTDVGAERPQSDAVVWLWNVFLAIQLEIIFSDILEI